MFVLRLAIGQSCVRVELDETDAMRPEHVDRLKFDGMDLEFLIAPGARRILHPIRKGFTLQRLLGMFDRYRKGISDGHLLIAKGEAEILHDDAGNGSEIPLVMPCNYLGRRSEGYG